MRWTLAAKNMPDSNTPASTPSERSCVATTTTTVVTITIDEVGGRSEEHTSELQSLMRISYAVFCLKKKNRQENQQNEHGNDPNIYQLDPTIGIRSQHSIAQL